MLAEYMKPGLKIFGLGALVTSGKPGLDCCYRVAHTASGTVLEFFEQKDRNGEQLPAVKVLPYRTGVIATMPVGGAEVISGEFTGCVMSLYEQGGTLLAAHVDTNPATSQRDNYAQLLKQDATTLKAECDTVGKIKPGNAHPPGTVMLCIADNAGIKEYFVSKSSFQVSRNVAGPGGGIKQWRLIGETMYTVLRP